MKFKNKVQEYAYATGIENENQLRIRLFKLGVPAGTSFKLWNEGATNERQWKAIRALESVLGVPAEKFLESSATN